MSKNDTQHALVPRLRFPEFRDAPGWEEATVGSRCLSFSGGTPETTRNEFYGGTIPFIRSAEIGRESTELFLTEEALESSAAKLVERGDVLVALYGANSGDVALARVDGAINQAILCLRPDGSKPFLYHYLTSRQEWILSTYLQGGQGNLSGEIVKSVTLGFPCANEQRKIAACLGSLDDLIAVEGRKLAGLREHKQGLMQQLFPREGETRPRLRFPEFRDAGEWQGRELGPMTSKVGSGITPTGGSKNYKDSGRPFVRSQNVGWGCLILDDVVHIDEETHAGFDGSEIQQDDVLLNISGASIGRSAVAEERVIGGNVNQHVCIIRADRDSIHPLMLSQFLISEFGQNQIDQCQAGGNRQGLNFGQIRSFTIPVPPSVGEQKRIADCLAALDALIAAQGEKLDALRTHKRGLMQQLFPSPEDD